MHERYTWNPIPGYFADVLDSRLQSLKQIERFLTPRLNRLLMAYSAMMPRSCLQTQLPACQSF